MNLSEEIRSSHRRRWRIIPIRTHPNHRLPFRDLPDKFGITVVTDECPALLGLVASVVKIRSILFYKRLRVFQVAVDGLYGCSNAVFLYR